MTKTVVGLYDRYEDAQMAARDLLNSGFSQDDISLVANNANNEIETRHGDGETQAAEGAGAGAVGGTAVGGVAGLLAGLGALTIPGIGPAVAAGTLATTLGMTAAGAGIGAAAGGLVGGLVGAGIPDEDAHVYAEGIRRGGTLLMVQTSDDLADDAARILQQYNVVDIDERGNEYRTGGWNTFDDTASPYASDDITRFRTESRPAARTTEARDGEVLPVVEETLDVSKRQVSQGGVRIHSRVTETPVEEDVRLRDERVNVQRRPVDRPATEADFAGAREGTFEMRETTEEAVVSKQARVIEEVIVDRDVRERTETVRDTVRHTDVDVEQIGTERAVGTSGFSGFDTDFRDHYQQNYATSGGTYDQYSPIYRYGYDLGMSDRYSGSDWATVEPEARRQWEERNPGTWENFKDSVRYAWDRARGAR